MTGNVAHGCGMERKRCAECGRECLRGRYEGRAAWLLRVYCDTTCRTVAMVRRAERRRAERAAQRESV